MSQRTRPPLPLLARAPLRHGPRLWRVSLGLMLAGLTACGDVAGVAKVDGGPAAEVAGADADSLPLAQVGGANELGEGFVDWSAGAPAAAILRGPQGGQHIWVSALTRNLWYKKARVAVTLYVEATGAADEMVKPGRVEVTGTLKSADQAGWLIYAGLPAFVKEPCKIMNKRVRVELEVSDLYAVKATDKAWITPTWDGYCDP
jgi:hypothetical protein